MSEQAAMKWDAYEKMILRAERDRFRREKRLDIAPEFRPALWGEAYQANDDLGAALMWASELLSAVRSQTERLAEALASNGGSR